MNSLKDILYKVLTTRVAWPILITVGMLCLASVLSLKLSFPARADRQELWQLIGVGVILMSILPHFYTLGRLAYALYAAAVALLIAVLFAPAVANTHRWFVLPGDVQVQPSELAKIAFVLALAWYLRYRKNLRTFSGLLIPFGLALVPFSLILVEPDLGTAMLFPLVLFAMLIAAGARLRHLAIIVLVAVTAAPGLFPLLKPYQQERVKSILKQFMGLADASHWGAAGFQQLQSMRAIGSGGFWGMQADARQYVTLVPEAHTDFIFAAVGAQWGFVGCMLLLFMYVCFFMASVEISASTRDNFGKLMVVGLASMILFQALINLLMTVGLGPVTGIALPFVSYGGSSLLASMLAAGLLLNVSVRRNFQSAAK